MKKLLFLTLALMLALTALIVPAMAEEARPVRVVGELAKSNMTEEDLDSWLAEEFEKGWYVFEDNHLTHFEYYDDLSSMLLALNAGTIDEISLPRFAAEYVVKTNPELKICCVERMPYEMSLLFGFRDDEIGRDLQERMNEAIRSMKADGTLDALERDYLKQELPQIKLIEPEGTYLIWLDFRGLGLNNQELEDLIIHKAGLWLDSGAIFGKVGQGFQRINIATSRSILEEALEKIKAAVQSLE